MLADPALPAGRRRLAASWTPGLLALLALSASLAPPGTLTVAAADYASWDLLMDADPRIAQVASKLAFPDNLLSGWIAALQRDEEETGRLAAVAIARAHRSGMIGCQGAIAPLREALEQARSPATQASVAMALCQLDDQASLSVLSQVADREITVAAIVEPALARWDMVERRPAWRALLTDRSASNRRRQLAIEACGVVGDAEATRPLLDLVRSAVEPDSIRLAAADAAASLVESIPLETVRAVSVGDRPLNRLLAARLLSRRRQPQTGDLLRRLAADKNMAVAAAAYAALSAHWPELAMEDLAAALDHDSFHVRLAAVELLGRTPTEPAAIQRLGEMLSDGVFEVRAAAGRLLVQAGQLQDRRDAVLQQLDRALESPRWQAHVQAARCAVKLKHAAAVPACLALLGADHPRSRIAAAWLLGRLAAPAHTPQLLRHADRLVALIDGQNARAKQARAELLQLFQALGRNRAREAAPLFGQLFPPKRNPAPLRVASIWGLGRIYDPSQADAPQTPLDLAAAFMERVADIEGNEPEDPVVRAAAMIALGRTNSRQHIAELEAFLTIDSPYTIDGGSLRWALHQLTGQEFPTPERLRRTDLRWFLIPLEPGKLQDAAPR